MTVRQIAARVPLPPTEAADATAGPHRAAFSDLLKRAHGPPEVAVSAEAAAQLDARGVPLTAPLRARIAEALDTLAAAGARDAVLLGPDAALVVRVPDRTVVTALAPDDLRGRAVTQIDSALLL